MENKCLTDKKSSITLFLLIWILYALVYMTKTGFSAAMAKIVSDGMLTKTQTGTITAVFYLIYAPFQIVGGLAADKYSPKLLILIGLIGAFLSSAIIYVSQDYTVMLITWALNAALQFGVWPSIFKICCTQVAEEHRQKALVYILTASYLGMVLSYIRAAVLTKWQDNFLLSAVVMLLSIILWMLLYGKLEKRMVCVDSEVDSQKPQEAKVKVSMPKIFISSGLLLLLLVALIQSMLNSGITTLTPVMLTESYENLSPSLATALNTILVITSLFGVFAARLIFPKYIKDEASSVTVLFFIMLPFFAFVFNVGKSPVWLILSVLTLLILLLASVSQFTYMRFAARFYNLGKAATVSGIFNCMASLGFFSANYGFSKLADTMGWGITVTCWALLAVVATLLAAASVPLWKRFLKSSAL